MDFPVASNVSYHPGDSCNRTLAVKRSKPYPPRFTKHLTYSPRQLTWQNTTMNEDVSPTQNGWFFSQPCDDFTEGILFQNHPHPTFRVPWTKQGGRLIRLIAIVRFQPCFFSSGSGNKTVLAGWSARQRSSRGCFPLIHGCYFSCTPVN